MGAKQLAIKQGTDEWRAWRKKGVGASESPALLGKSPYFTRRDLWFDKTGLEEIYVENSWALTMGHAIEDKLRAQFEKQTKIEMQPVCMERDDIFLASFDGYDPGKGVLECKFVGKAVLAKAKTGVIPEHHLIQIQHQLFVADHEKAFWCGHDGKNAVAVEIGRDESIVAQIAIVVPEFWKSVVDMIEPPLTSDDTLYITKPTDQKLFKDLLELKARRDEIEAQYKALEEKIKGLSDHPKIQCQGVTVTTVERAGTINYKAIPEFKNLSPEYVEQFRSKPSTYKKITFKGGKDE